MPAMVLPEDLVGRHAGSLREHRDQTLDFFRRALQESA
jgi:hypothetical protein